MTTTITETDRAKAMGREAAHRGDMAAPSLNAPFMAMLGNPQVGDPRTVELMRAFGRGYAEGYPNERGDGHAHDWRDLAELDGKHRNYFASYCPLCGTTMID